MTENEQIQKMAEILYDKCNRDCIESCEECTAQTLYKADYRKVERGEWIITNNRDLEIIRECSVCHAKAYYPINPQNLQMYKSCYLKTGLTIDVQMNIRKSPHCEDCGADMRGEGNEQHSEISEEAR